MHDSGRVVTTVIAAMRMEARTARPLIRGGCSQCISGIGVERARAAALAAVEGGARRLLVWGCAGGLIHHLAPGTVVVPRVVLSAAGERFEADAVWRAELLARAPAGVPVNDGNLVTTARPLGDPGEKGGLAQRSGAIAADMETAAIAAIAAARGLPFAAVRAIADPLEFALPRAVTAVVSERFLAPEVALRLLGRPQDIAAVRRLAGFTRAAKSSLAAFARSLAATP
ncbi:MAG: hypothetical protein ACRESR_04650 [Gammaproteobacteria bacterium]